MIDNREFVDTVIERLRERLGAAYELDSQTITKNNGIVRTGIWIKEKGKDMAPVIYLDPYHEQYSCGTMSMEEIVEDIRKVFENNSGYAGMHPKELLDFEKVRDRILFKLVNSEKNREFLGTVPHVPFLDLGAVFYLLVGQNEAGVMTVTVSNEVAGNWGKTPGELLSIAAGNAARIYTPRLRRMEDVLNEICGMGTEGTSGEEPEDILCPDKAEPSFYVLSNCRGLYGAAAILYPGVLQRIAGLLGKDLVILPSSVHEVLLLCHEPGMDFEALREMVGYVNANEVAADDRLSDQVYIYRREDDKILLAGE